MTMIPLALPPLGPRLKALTIALLVALALLGTARVANADDDWLWLRILCAPVERGGIMWILLGCDRLPDDVHSPNG